jgi:thioredoxin reductase/cytochrome b561
VQGTQVAATIERRRRAQKKGSRSKKVKDLVIVGAGPGGLACALASRQLGLSFELIDQETSIGGTVAKYPRRKLVVTDTIELPLHGRLEEREYEKEELIALWQDLARVHELPFRGGVTFERVERRDDGTFDVHTDAGILRARNVVLAVGRRGMPRRLGVPGEDLPHVAYGLLDAAAYTGQHVVVVGGGDSAVETALVLAEQPDNKVTIVYRKDAFFRVRRRNRERLEKQLADGRIEALFSTEVTSIAEGSVHVAQHEAAGTVAVLLQADHVFVMAGGVPPFAQLEQSGVSFDPAQRPPAPALLAAPFAAAPLATARPGGLLPALAVGLALATAALGFVLWHSDYYTLPAAARAADPKHALLRSDRSLGLWFGLLAMGAIGANLAYLLRRHQRWGFRFGQLSTWMTAHVGTGVVAVLLVMLHAAMAPRETPGGHAFWALVLLLATGAIGRWFYAWLPRSANGRELELGQIRAELAVQQGFGGGSSFGKQAQAEVLALLDRRQWRSSWPGRVLCLLGLQRDLRSTLRRLRRHGREAHVEPAVLAQVLEHTRAAHRAAIAVAHLEDLRALLGTWRWLHRWLALLMVVLVLVHVVTAVWHGVFAGGGGL